MKEKTQDRHILVSTESVLPEDATGDELEDAGRPPASIDIELYAGGQYVQSASYEPGYQDHPRNRSPAGCCCMIHLSSLMADRRAAVFDASTA